MSSSILEVIPQLTSLVIQGRRYIVGQLLMQDMAALQAYVESLHPHPLEARRFDLMTAEEDRRKILARLDYEDFLHVFPMGGDEWNHAFCLTFEGRTFWLALLLGKHNEFTAVDAADLAGRIGWEELAALQRVAYFVTPSLELRRMLHPVQDDTTDPFERETLSQDIDDLARSHGWTYEQIGNLTLSQFQAAKRQGKAIPRIAVDLSGMSHEERVAYVKKQQEDIGLKENNG